MKKILSLILISVFSVTFFAGCKKDKGEPPVLPPAGSMAIDFSNFSATKKSLEVLPPVNGTTNSNWQYSALVVGYWSIILNTTLAIPVAAFEAAINQTPVYVSSKNWQWSFSVTFLNTTYKARLTGLIRSSDVLWNMYISKDGTDSYKDFLWFTGTSQLDGSHGQWILNQSPTVNDPILQIDWTKTATAIGSVKYTYIKNDSFLNSSIEYGLTSSDLNAYFNIHYFNGVKYSDVNIEWNTTTHNGHVKSVDYLGDSNWYCWDSNKINITCP